MKLYWSWLWILLLPACSEGKKQPEVEVPLEVKEAYDFHLDVANVSRLDFPLDFVTRDLEQVINDKLPKILVDETMSISDKGDSLAVIIETLGRATLFSSGNKIYTSIPLQVSAVITKRVLGIKFSNKQPIDFSINLGVETKLAFNDRWELNPSCTLSEVTWIEKPEMDLLLVKVNLEKIIDRQIEKNKDKLESALCELVHNAVPIRAEVKKVWQLMSDPHRVAKKPVELWLNSNPDEFSASFDTDVKDTLRVNIHCTSSLAISPEAPLDYEPAKLPLNRAKKRTGEGLQLKAAVTVPAGLLNQLLQSKLEGQNFAYQGVSIDIRSVRATVESDHLSFIITIVGDIESTIQVKARPELDKDRQLSIEDIEIEVLSDNQFMSTLAWLTNATMKSYLTDATKVDLNPLLSTLDEKIMAALDKSNTGKKIDLKLIFDTVEEDRLIFENDQFIWLFDIEGRAQMRLLPELLEPAS
ncbi:MAG: DUF4403 family protein [Cyclobacteriaceae bacterium]